MTQALAHAPRADRRRPAAADPQRARAARRDRARVRPLQRRGHAARPVDLPHARDDRAHDRPAQRRRRRRVLVADARPPAVHLVRQRVPADHGRDLAPPGVRRRRSAVRRAGRATYVAALRRVHGNAPAFDSYWMEEVVPVLDTKRRPPVGDGLPPLRRRRRRSSEAAQAYLERELEEGKTDAYDSHPSLPERIAAIEGMPDGDPDDSPCSIELLADPAAAEQRVLDVLIGLDARSFKPVAWDEVGVEVYVQRAPRRPRRISRSVLDGVTLGEPARRRRADPGHGDKLRAPEDDPQAAMQGSSPACSATASCSRCTAPAGRSRRRRPSPSGRAAATTVLLPHAAVHKLCGGGALRGRVARAGAALRRGPPPARRAAWPLKTRGPRSTPGASLTTMLDSVAVTDLSKAAGGTNSGIGGGGAPVWIPLERGSSAGWSNGRAPPGSHKNCHSTSDHPLSLVIRRLANRGADGPG